MTTRLHITRSYKSQSIHAAAVFFKRDKKVNQTAISEELLLNGLVVVKIKCDYCIMEHYDEFIVSIILDKVLQWDSLIYAVTFSSFQLGIKEKVIYTDDTSWNPVCEDADKQSFDVYLSLEVVNSNAKLYAPLYADTELVDFELCGKDGSVQFHKVMLANFSPVLKTMICGQWKEANTGSCQVQASKETLQQLKDFIYLRKLPESDDVEALAELASYYMNEDLKIQCSVKLLRKVEAENISFFMEFGPKYKLRYLSLGIIAILKYNLICFKDIENVFYLQDLNTSNK